MDKRINIWVNGKEVENNIKSIRSAMAHLTNQLNNMEIGSAEYVETSKKIRDLKAIYDEHCKCDSRDFLDLIKQQIIHQ